MRADDAATLEAFLHAWELLNEDEFVRLARFQGDVLRRVATTNVRFFDELVRLRVDRMDVSEAEGAPRRPPAIAFLDLTGFTSLTEDRGDTAAAELAGRLVAVVDEVSRDHGGQAVKWLGDGVMFYFADPAGACAAPSSS